MTALTHPVSAKVRDWISRAEALGLAVTVEHKFDGVIESVTLNIERPKVEERNMLDVVHNHDRLWVYSTRIDPVLGSSARWSHTAMKHGYAVTSYGVPVRRVQYVIDGLAE
jgi:hypothetical protein